MRFIPCLMLMVLFAPSVCAQYDPAAPEPMRPLNGTLILGGGGQVPELAYAAFVRAAGGKDAKIAFFPDPEGGPRHRAKIASLGVEQGSSEPVPLRDATGVWITAPDPATFARTVKGKPAETTLRDVVRRGGVVAANGPIVRTLTDVMMDTSAAQTEPAASVVFRDDHGADGVPAALKSKVTAHPEVVALGIESDTAVVLQRRWIDVVGSGSAHAYVAASKTRPLLVERINRRESPVSQRRGIRARPRRLPRRRPGDASRFRQRRLADLVALSRNAQARVAPTFPAYKPVPPNVKHGSLIIIGGGGMPEGLMKRFIELAGGPDAPLVYIPCEERPYIDRIPRMLQVWKRLGATDVDWLHTKDRAVADGDEKLLTKLRRARGIWFGGGRQWNLVDSYQHTTAHKLMHEVIARGGVIAGSSAGASIQASYMVRGNPVGNLDPMAEGYETGLGFLTGVAIDQHFSQRNRLADMTALVGRYPEVLGIGLDEAAALVVKGTVAEAVTNKGRNVLVYDRSKPLPPGGKDHLVLRHGERFDLAARARITAPKDR